MKKAIYLYVLACILAACGNEQKVEKTQEVMSINLKEEERVAPLSEWVDSVSFIPLETRSGNMIGSIDKLIVNDSLYIVVDKELAASVFLFDKKGRFLRRIGDLGRAKGEYLALADVATDGEHIFVLDDKGRKVNSYSFSGDWVESFDFNYTAYSFAHLSGKKFVFYCDYGKNYDLLADGMMPNVIFYDFETGGHTEALPFESSLSNNVYPLTINNLTPYLHESMGRNVYGFDEKGLYPYVEADYGDEYNAKLDDFNRKVREGLLTEDDFAAGQTQLPLPMWITFLDCGGTYFTFHTKGSYLYYNLFSPAKGIRKEAVGKGRLPVKDDLYHCIPVMPKSAAEGVLYCDLDPATTDTSALPFVVGSEDNPVIVILHLKGGS